MHTYVHRHNRQLYCSRGVCDAARIGLLDDPASEEGNGLAYRIRISLWESCRHAGHLGAGTTGEWYACLLAVAGLCNNIRCPTLNRRKIRRSWGAVRMTHRTVSTVNEKCGQRIIKRPLRVGIGFRSGRSTCLMTRSIPSCWLLPGQCKRHQRFKCNRWSQSPR